MWRGRFEALERHAVAISLVLALAGVAVVHLVSPQRPVIDDDGIGYYLYLPSLFIHHELGYEHVALDIAARYGSDVPARFGLRRHPDSGRLVDKYGVGTALFLTPTFLVADSAALVSGARRDGFSWPYQVAAAIPALLCLMGGIALLRIVLRERVSRAASGCALALLLLGTNLLNYVAYDATYSHVFSFLLFAVLLAVTERWQRHDRWTDAAIVGATLGLIVLVRPSNACVALVPALYAVRAHRPPARQIGLVVATAFAVFFPQMWLWKAGSTHWIVQPYLGEQFHFDAPQILPILFSLRAGVFVHTPLLLVFMAGLGTRSMRSDRLFWPVACTMAVHVYVAASWWCWWYGPSFGHRAFTEYLALLVIPGAAACEWALRRGPPLVAVMWTLAVANTVWMLGYWLRPLF